MQAEAWKSSCDELASLMATLKRCNAVLKPAMNRSKETCWEQFLETTDRAHWATLFKMIREEIKTKNNVVLFNKARGKIMKKLFSSCQGFNRSIGVQVSTLFERILCVPVHAYMTAKEKTMPDKALTLDSIPALWSFFLGNLSKLPREFWKKEFSFSRPANLIAVADDLTTTVRALRSELFESRCNEKLRHVYKWMVDTSLIWAPGKGMGFLLVGREKCRWNIFFWTAGNENGEDD